MRPSDDEWLSERDRDECRGVRFGVEGRERTPPGAAPLVNIWAAESFLFFSCTRTPYGVRCTG